jgi:predicted nucleotidyltransferase component of viral defense system
MIPAREILDLRTEWSLDVGVIEKDYVLGWLLAGIANDPDLSKTWVFKGGTCLRKCYYETYRFSEDLDFTVVGGRPGGARGLSPNLPQNRRMAS